MLYSISIFTFKNSAFFEIFSRALFSCLIRAQGVEVSESGFESRPCPTLGVQSAPCPQAPKAQTVDNMSNCFSRLSKAFSLAFQELVTASKITLPEKP